MNRKECLLAKFLLKEYVELRAALETDGPEMDIDTAWEIAIEHNDIAEQLNSFECKTKEHDYMSLAKAVGYELSE